MKIVIKLPHLYDLYLETSRSRSTYHTDAYRPWAWVRLGYSSAADEPGRFAGRRLWLYWPKVVDDGNNPRRLGWPAVHFDVYIDRGEKPWP